MVAKLLVLAIIVAWVVFLVLPGACEDPDPYDDESD